jgi:hypothetical protein
MTDPQGVAVAAAPETTGRWEDSIDVIFSASPSCSAGAAQGQRPPPAWPAVPAPEALSGQSRSQRTLGPGEVGVAEQVDVDQQVVELVYGPARRGAR